MQEWLKISCLLSVFGFLKEIRPSEPFVYEFLIDQRWRNVTNEEVTQKVYPVATYSYLAHLVLIFLITDLCRYKPLIVVLGISGIIVWSLLLWTESLVGLQIVEVFYGTFSAAEVAYFTYIYAKVDIEYFQQVTSHTRAAILAGRAVSGVSSQLLISFNAMNYRQLNYITFTAMLVATPWAIFLPPVKTSIYFHQRDTLSKNLRQKVYKAFDLMRVHFTTSFNNKYVIKWSLWYAFSLCGFIQVQTYMQPLWTQILSDPSKPIYNGAVEAVLTLLGFAATLCAGVLKISWEVKGDLILVVASLSEGFILLYSSRTQYVVHSYICYVAFGVIFHFMITITSSEIAKYIENESYGLVFGVNSFLAVLMQTILTAVVVTEGIGFAMAPRAQYFVYGWYFIVVGAIYIGVGLKFWLSRPADPSNNRIILSVTD